MTTVQKLKQYLSKIKKENPKINAFLELRPEKELIKEAEEIDKKIKSGKAGKLAGYIIGIKANICVKGLHASCASKALENYVAPYDATVVWKIKKQDGLIIGMLNMDEFASGTSGETSAFGPTHNPAASGLIPGGSCSGSAAAIAAGFCGLTLGSDTGGSIRCPASFCGVVGIKPTYSAVSRYGLIDLAMSTDTIGTLAKNVADASLLLDVIKGRDEKDAISQDSDKKSSKITRVGILDLSGVKVESKVKETVDNAVDKLKTKSSWKFEKVKLNYLDLAVQTYYPIIYVEAFSGTRKLDGRRYGKKIEEVCGPEFLRRILGGSEITKAEHGGRYYYKALKVKDLIVKEFEKIFKKYDCIVCPTMPILPWKIGEAVSVEESYAADVLTIPASLSGSCAISVPAGKVKGIPVGLQIICDRFQEDKLIKIAKKFEGL